MVSSTLFKNRAETFKVPNYFSGDESLCGEEMKKRSSKMQNRPFPTESYYLFGRDINGHYS